MNPIWIVDDDQSIRFVLEKALLRDGLPTRSFTNPREVLQALEAAGDEGGPQVLVSDIRMPGGSGLDLLGKVLLDPGSRASSNSTTTSMSGSRRAMALRVACM